MNLLNKNLTAYLLITTVVSLLLTLTGGCSSAQHNASSSELSSLQAIVKSDHRSAKNRARDRYRHPIKTLNFFEVEPDMTVVEISPGAGWYTEILAPYLKDNGNLILAVYSDNSEKNYRRNLNKNLRAKIEAHPDVFGSVQYSIFEPPQALGPVAPANSADRVLTFRNVHNWISTGKAEEAFKAFYQALKPGGILGVVEHRAKNNQKQDLKASSGYVREDYIIQLAERAGFEFVAKSEVNANPKDSTNHPKGVWTLPPTLRLGEKDQDKYLKIGESDRMTLKFRK